LDKYFVNITACQSALSWAKSTGIAQADLLAGTDIPGDKINSADCMISNAQHYRFLHNLITLANEPAVGLHVGRMESLEGLGVLGLTMVCAPSIREALLVGARYSSISGSLGSISARIEDNYFIPTFELPPTGLAQTRYQVEDLFASIYNYVQTLASTPSQRSNNTPSPKVKAQRICFAYPQPDYYAEYQRVFDCELIFDATRNEMYLDNTLLDRPTMLFNDFAFQQCRQLCERLAREMREEQALPRDIRQHIARDPISMSTPDAIAEAMGMTVRTLQRQLQSCDTTLSALRDEVCLALSRELLNNPALTLEEIAASLGYSDASNFRRAFKRWTGVNPSQFRNTLRQSPTYS
jgi:AraC-like DNA-binding protein